MTQSPQTGCWTLVPPLKSSPCVVAACDLSGQTLVRWNRLWLRRLQESPCHSDTHWLIASANSPLPPSHKANTIKGQMLPHITWLLSVNIHQQISTSTSPQWIQVSVLPSLHTGLCCSNGAKHALVLGNLLNNAHWKHTCVTSISTKLALWTAVWVQSAVWQRWVKIPVDASQKGGWSINLDP